MTVEFIMLDKDSKDDGYLQQYYELRHKAFEHAFKGTNTIYKPEPDAYDLNPNTLHFFLVENGKVISGARLIRHRSGSDERVKLENEHDNLHIEKLLPGIDRKLLNYAELSGVIADPCAQDRMLSNRLLSEIAKAYRANKFDDDLIIGTANKLSAPISIRAAKKAMLGFCDRADTEFPAGTVMVRVLMLSNNPNFPFYGLNPKPRIHI
jgi:predicted GNAT family N-acyltransferase